MTGERCEDLVSIGCSEDLSPAQRERWRNREIYGWICDKSNSANVLTMARPRDLEPQERRRGQGNRYWS